MDSTRTINMRFLCWFILSLVVLGGAVLGVHAVQMSRNANIFKLQAEEASKAERYDDAARYYRLYMGYRPDDTEARRAWGQVLDKKAGKSPRELLRVYTIFEEVLRRLKERGQDDDDLRRRLVEIALTLRRFNDAMTHLEVLLQGNYPNDGVLEQQLATCYLLKDDQVKAKQYYLRAMEHAKHHLLSYIDYADMLRRKKDKESEKEADKTMLKMVEVNQDNYLAHLARARYLQKVGQNEELTKEIQKTYELAPTKEESILAVAELAFYQDDLKKSRTYLAKGLELFPQSADMYRVLSRVETRAGQPAEAVAVLRRGVKEVKPEGKHALLRALALLLLQQGEVAQAEDTVKVLRENGATPVELKELNAHILMHNKQWREAAAILESIRPILSLKPEGALEANLLLGMCYERRGEADRALGAFRQALNLNPRLPAARVGVASALLALGRLEDSLNEYEVALPSEPSVGVRVAQLLIIRNLRRDEAKRDWKRVHEVLDKAEAAAPKSTEIPILRAELFLDEGKPDQAEALLEKARDQQPDRIELWLALSNTAQVRGKGEKTPDILAAAERRLGDRVELRVARARYYIPLTGKGNKEAPAVLAKLEQDTNKFSRDEEGRLLRGLAEAYYRAGNAEQARRLWTQVAAKEPTDMQVRLTLFDLALQSGDDKALDDILKEMHEIEGEDGTLWRYSKASRIIARAKSGKSREGLTEARKLLAEALSRRQTWAPVLLRQADLDDLEGNQEEALQKYEQAFDLGDRSPLAVRRALQLLSERRLYTRADQLLAKVQNQTGGTALPPDLQRWQAALWAQQGQNENAIALARKPVEAGSKDPRDYVWLGQILWSAGKNDEAEKVFRQAIELPAAAKLAEPWVTFVQYLARTRQKAKALAVIRQAEQKLPVETSSLELAQCYEAVNEFRRADDQFKAALARKPDDLTVLRNVASFHLRTGNLKAAEPHLRKLLDPQTKAANEDVIWARRGLALWLASTGDYQQFLEAKQLIDENTKGQGGSIEDQRTKALILSSVPYHRREALRVLEAVINRQPPTPEEQLVLGQLYEAVRNWPMARQVFQQLASSDDKATYTSHAALALLRHGEVDEAQHWLSKLEQVDPDSPRTLEVQVRVLKAKGHPEEAAALVKKYAATPEANQDLCANLYEELGKTAEAEAIFRRRALTQAPERILVLALFYARQGRIDEALNLCERTWASVKPEVVASICLAVLTDSKSPTPQQFRRVETWLKTAIDKKASEPNSNTTALVLQLAGLRDLEQNYDEAVKLYREVVDKDPRNVVALNNLAWLLAARKEDLGEALGLVTKAIAYKGPMAQLRDTQGYIYTLTGETGKAIEELEKALDETERPAFYFHLALAQFKANQRNAAIKSLRAGHEKKLNRASLHPLERPAYEQLLKDLDEQ